MTKTVPSAAGGTGVARFKDQPSGVTPPTNPTRRGVFLTDVIIELGFADQDRVDAVVEAARNSAKTVEELLLEHGAVDEDQLYRAIAERNALDHVDLELFELDERATQKISAELALRHRAVPIALAEDGALIVAVADPFDSMTISDIEEAAGCEVRLAIARPRAIRRLLQRLHGEEPEPRETVPEDREDPDPEEPAAEAPVELVAAEAEVAAEEAELKEAVEKAEPEKPVDNTEEEEEPDARPEPEAKPEPAAPTAKASRNGGSPEDEDLQRVSRRAQRVEGELIVARRQVADLKRQLREQGAPSAELERSSAELERRNAQLKRMNATLDGERAELATESAELQAKLAELVAWAAEVSSAAEGAGRMATALDALREAVAKNPA